MMDFVRVQIYILSFMAVVSSLAVMMKSLNITAESFEFSCSQIQAMRISTVVLIVMYWFFATGSAHAVCLAKYAELSKTCCIIGGAWMAFSTIAVLIGIVSALIPASKSSIANLTKLRTSGFWMGAFYLFLSYLLKVV